MLNRPEKFQHLWKILWKFRGEWGRRIVLYEYLEHCFRDAKKTGESPGL